MVELVKQYISDNQLISENKPVLVALSGGRDSIALLDILCQIGCECVVLHCNFHLRGQESLRDEEFVRQLCEEKNVNLIIRHFDTKAYSEEHGISIEMAARELRYAWFETMCKKLKAQAIAVAHHKDDQAETILLNLIRGTGMRGLVGMKSRNGNIIRPLLCLTREQIDAYIADRHLQYVDDSTNSETLYKRNKIRHDIIPILQQINPSVVNTLCNNAEAINSEQNLLHAYVEQERERLSKTQKDTIEIDIQQLASHPMPCELLFELIRDYGFNWEQCRIIANNLEGQSGKRFIAAEYELIKDRDTLFIYKKDTEDRKPEIEISKRQRKDNEHFPSAKAKKAFFDAKILDQPLTLRHWQYGDSFYPLGMTQSKKLSDFFVDQKISLQRKSRLWLLLSGEDIVWIIGERIDNRYKVRHSTKEVVEISIRSEN